MMRSHGLALRQCLQENGVRARSRGRARRGGPRPVGAVAYPARVQRARMVARAAAIASRARRVLRRAVSEPRRHGRGLRQERGVLARGRCGRIRPRGDRHDHATRAGRQPEAAHVPFPCARGAPEPDGFQQRRRREGRTPARRASSARAQADSARHQHRQVSRYAGRRGGRRLFVQLQGARTSWS